MADEPSYMDHLDRRALIAAMGSPKPSTDDLDLTSLPDRLDDETLSRVKLIAQSPLPDPIPCDERHFGQCLRVLLAVLPKRNSDDLSGELFVSAYQRKLGSFSRDAISFLADKAMERCQWFPTIAECLEILGDYHRQDQHTRRKLDAQALCRREENLRHDERTRAYEAQYEPMTQADVDAMDESLKRIGVRNGWLIKNETGKLVLAPQ